MKAIIIEKEKIELALKLNTFKKDACALLGVSIDVLNKLIKQYGISFTRTSYKKGKSFISLFKFVDRDWLYNNWVCSDKSLSDLSEEFDVPLSTLEYRVKSFGISKKYKYSVNKLKLFSVSDPNVNYLAGLIATDGYVLSNHDTVDISLSGPSEMLLLLDICTYFDITSPIKQFGNSYRLRFSVDGLREFLFDNFSIPCGNKTPIVGFPNRFYSEDCKKAFLLGCFDGDGCISHLNSGGSLMILTQSEQFILGIRNALISSGFDMNFRYERDYPGLYCGGTGCIQILRWMYSTSCVLKLDRKYNKYLALIKRDDDIV